jgi:sulfur carrier protein
MKIKVNGEDREVADGVTVADLLVLLGAPPEGVAVAVDAEVVPRREYGRRLSPGARVEVIRAVGGG